MHFAKENLSEHNLHIRHCARLKIIMITIFLDIWDLSDVNVILDVNIFSMETLLTVHFSSSLIGGRSNVTVFLINEDIPFKIPLCIGL